MKKIGGAGWTLAVMAATNRPKGLKKGCFRRRAEVKKSGTDADVERAAPKRRVTNR